MWQVCIFLLRIINWGYMSKILLIFFILFYGNTVRSDIILELPKDINPVDTKLAATWINNNDYINLKNEQPIEGINVSKRLSYSKRAGEYKIIINGNPKENRDIITLKYAVNKKIFPEIKLYISDNTDNQSDSKINSNNITPNSRYKLTTRETNCPANSYEISKSTDNKYLLCLEKIY